MIVFVSYSSINREQVESLIMRLGELGHDVEYEAKFVGAPITWRHVLSRIEGCEVFIATLTSASLASYSCEIEYQYAQALGKNVLPVLLEDITMLGTHFQPVVDLRTDSQEAYARLEQTLNKLRPSPLIPVHLPPDPDWVAPLAEIRRRIEAMHPSSGDQHLLSLNIREFLERRETFEVARSLLDFMASQAAIQPEVLNEVGALRRDLIRSRAAIRKARRQRTLMGALALSLSVSIIVFIASQLFFRFRAERNAASALTATVGAGVISTRSPTNVIVVTTALVSINQTSTPQVAAPLEQVQPITPTVLLATNTHLPVEVTADDGSTTTSVPSLSTPATIVPTLVPSLPTLISTAASNEMQVPLATATPILIVQPISTTVLPDRMSETTYSGFDVNDTIDGLLVSAVGENARAAGVREGDYLLVVNAEPVTTREQFQRVVQSYQPLSKITVWVRRGSSLKTMTFVVAMDDHELATALP